VNINATLLGQMITFALFVWFTMKFVWPLVSTALEERQAKVADGLAAAERGHRDLELSQTKAKDTLREAREEITRLTDVARSNADQILEQAKVKAAEEAKRTIARSQEEVSRMVLEAKQQLQSEVAALAVLGAERILARSIDASIHNDMLEKLAKEL